MNDKKDAAVATLENLGYTHEGGNLWKPPLGKAPDSNLLDTLHARIASLEAQLSARRAAPDGWRLVPESPTDAMQTACKSVVDLEQGDPDDHRYDDGLTTVNAIYAAMLSAAPPPPELETGKCPECGDTHCPRAQNHAWPCVPNPLRKRSRQ
ncbi:MAG: hypothetical protein ACN6O1_10445 [Comamonas sp.]|uniref:hypothetical protein n=1 Tax=Comamonas sp. TaxID=34028 RepID=UPI003D118311